MSFERIAGEERGWGTERIIGERVNGERLFPEILGISFSMSFFDSCYFLAWYDVLIVENWEWGTGG